MSILDRLNLLVRSELNDISRPDRFRSAMSEMESSLRDAKRQQITLRKGEAQLIEQVRSGRQRSEMWEHRAVLALKAGEEDLAREALVQKNKVLAEVEKIRDQLDEQRAYLKDISRALEALEMKLQGTRGRIDLERPRSTSQTSQASQASPTKESDWDRELQRRLRTKKSDDYIPPFVEDTADLSNPATFSEFDRMAGKIQSLEANIDAMRELSVDDIVDPRRRELEDIFSKMEKKKRTTDDLSDLKARFKE